MIPKFLEQFKGELEKFKLESIRIKATPINESESLAITQSKFLGKPYLTLTSTYPIDRSGNPMILLAQIHFSEMPHLKDYPTEGILQFFISPTDWYDMEDYRIIYHQTIEKEYQTDFTFLTENLYEESPVYCEHKLSFEKIIEYGGVVDVRFNMKFDGESYYDYQEKLAVAQRIEMDNLLEGGGHKIGGYAFFTQVDPRDGDRCKKDELLLLQIDTDEQIMFGDSGLCNLFINPKSLNEKDFSKAWFNWDCC